MTMMISLQVSSCLTSPKLIQLKSLNSPKIKIHPNGEPFIEDWIYKVSAKINNVMMHTINLSGFLLDLVLLECRNKYAKPNVHNVKSQQEGS